MAHKGNNLVTKLYLDKKLKSFKDELKTELRTDLKSDLSGELYKIKDEIVGEIKTMREEFNVHQYSHVRIDEELEDHEKRIVVLE